MAVAGGGHCLAGHPPAAQVLIPCRPVTKAILALQLHPALLDIACAEEKSCVESGGGDPGWTKKRGGVIGGFLWGGDQRTKGGSP